MSSEIGILDSSSGMKLGPLLGVCLQRAPLTSAFVKGPDRPGLSVVAAVLFFVGPSRDMREPGGQKGRVMRRIQADWAEVAVYERIVQVYTPYILVRCARYTNGRRQAQQIGVYTLVTACLLARRLGHVLPFGTVLEIVLRMVGPDVLAGACGEDWRIGADAPLLVSPRMRYLATSLNALKRRGREVLVLHHLGGLPPEDLARLLGQPVEQVQARLGRAERRLAQWLGAADVRSRLAEFAAGLDRGWMQEVADGALEYLARHAGGSRRRRAHGDWN
jgi:hypothetical protein